MDLLTLAKEKKGFEFSEAFKKVIAEKIAARREELKPQVGAEMFGEEKKPFFGKKDKDEKEDKDEDKDDKDDDDEKEDKEDDDEDDE